VSARGPRIALGALMSGVGFALYRYADTHQPAASAVEDLGKHLVGAEALRSDEYMWSLVISVALMVGGMATVVRGAVAREGLASAAPQAVPAAAADATVSYHLGVAWKRHPIACSVALLVPLGCLLWLVVR
jgi:hypothetical protein